MYNCGKLENLTYPQLKFNFNTALMALIKEIAESRRQIIKNFLRQLSAPPKNLKLKIEGCNRWLFYVESKRHYFLKLLNYCKDVPLLGQPNPETQA